MLPAADGATLVELPALTTPFIEQDWARWHDGLAALERDWFAPALAAVQNGGSRASISRCAATRVP